MISSFLNTVTYKTKQNYGYQQCVQDFVRKYTVNMNLSYLTKCAFISSLCKVNDAHEQGAIKNFHQNEKKVIFDILYKNEYATRNAR